MKQLVKVIAILLCAVILLTACGSKTSTQNPNDKGAAATPGSSAAAEKKDPSTLIYAASSEPSKLDPQNNDMLGGMLIERQAYDTLVSKDEATGKITPRLATEWKWVDNTTLAMTLRNDVYFQNGEKMTAKDVIFTIQRFAKGSATASLYSSFDGEHSVIVDDTHVQIKFKAPYSPALNMLANIRAAIVCKSYIESVGDKEIARKTMGTGAFCFENWVSGDRLTMVRNDKYWSKAPIYKNLVFRFLVDPTARMVELQTGGVDIIETLQSQDIDRMKAGVKGCKLYEVDGYKFYWIAMSELSPFFSNQKVREAIAHVLDINAIAEAAFGVAAKTADSSLGSNIFGYEKQGFYKQDLELAKKLLAEAGYPNGFKIDLVLSEAVHNVKAGEIIQAMLSKIGVTVNVKVFDGATESSMKSDGSSLFLIGNLTSNTGDPDQAFFMHTKNSSVKSIRISDAKFNELLLAGKSEIDTDKRAKIYAEAQQYVFKNVLEIPLAQAKVTYGTRDYLQNFTPDAGTQPDLSGVTFAK